MTEYAQSAQSRLDLTEVLSIDKAAELRDELLHRLQDASTIIVDFSRVKDIDLACIQVLYAARKSAQADNKKLHLAGDLDEKVRSRFSDSGFSLSRPDRAEKLETELIGF